MLPFINVHQFSTEILIINAAGCKCTRNNFIYLNTFSKLRDRLFLIFHAAH